nr:HAD family phosphatase [uncultured Blautia sp.]
MIQNLIFDVGDVLLEYRWFEMLTRDYGISEAEARRIGGEMFDNEIWVQGMDGGRLSLDEAVHEYEKKYPDDVDVIGWFLKNGEQMAIKRPEVWDKIAALKDKGYSIYILSNYSEELFRMHTKGALFLDLLDGGIVSYQVHALKPEPEIYQILLGKYGLQAEECLFFDDRADNVESARALGIRAVQVTSREMLNETLDKMLTE